MDVVKRKLLDPAAIGLNWPLTKKPPRWASLRGEGGVADKK
jgi:hypothetical protein